jgi:KDO2-lipid IV(A) lauroyltransferase
MGAKCVVLNVATLIEDSSLSHWISKAVPPDHYHPRRFGAWQDWIVHPFQGFLLWLLITAMRCVSIEAASSFGGFVGRIVGPRLGVSRRADANLRMAMPHLDPPARLRIIEGMWDNLGRVMCEYPHLYRIVKEGRVEFTDPAGVKDILHWGEPVVFFGAHLGNWEILAPFASTLGIEMSVVYRSPNNRFADRLVRWMRAAPGLNQIRKGPAGGRETVRVIRSRGVLALLIDQKFSAGLPVPFFGRDAMTAPAAAQFGVRYGAHILPARVERCPGVRFKITVYPALECSQDTAVADDRVDALPSISSGARSRAEEAGGRIASA